MTTQQLSMADLPKFFLGFDRMHEQFLNNTFDNGYPRYNIVKTGDSGYLIELAIPGWDKSDVEISLHKNILTIKGTRKQTTKDEEVYLHKGLSGKCFKRTFQVGEYIELEKAYMERGLLCIRLQENIPAEELPKYVEIA
jgi:molecular chaperone IbpA